MINFNLLIIDNGSDQEINIFGLNGNMDIKNSFILDSIKTIELQNIRVGKMAFPLAL